MDILKERPGLFNLVFGAIGFPTGRAWHGASEPAL
jgi:hypothetical protein